MGTIGVVLVEAPEIGQGPRFAALFTDGHILGTDNQGRDLLALTVHATPAMLEMIISGAVFTTIVATIVGTVSGYKGGIIDRISMVVTDIMLTIPGLPLVIVIAAILDPRTPWVVGIVLTINAWAGLARTIRAQVLTVREESYVEASRVMGFSTSGILRRDIIPQLMPYIGVNFMQAARNVIFASVGLYYLGVLPFTHYNWGIILNQAYGGGALWNVSYFHWMAVPIVTISLISLSLILLTQSADRVFNPRVRAKHSRTISDDDDAVEHN
ncbi:ABC transporter permease [Halobacteria archaeon AArc-m2/3/4]|uniref:ABC transporter permease n=1 Tax=Natronoglomus mannanivorans TaxID=2979990 RepID=A0AAP2Z4C5_9EURY|nr:ABC transporter permease [Halobacteria archaeon AArc-xg1-1]MCU4975965.1 ABC transporter permease [Halobacteria archaeon AArc-m2/3/4]